MGRLRVRRRPSRPRGAVSPRPTPAEARLLTLASDLTRITRRVPVGDPEALRAAVLKVGDAYRPGAPLPAEMCRARLGSRKDKNATLALSWAREQVRLGLEEALARAGSSGMVRTVVPAELLSWLLLVACEAIAHEAPSAVADRLRSILELAGAPDVS